MVQITFSYYLANIGQFLNDASVILVTIICWFFMLFLFFV